METINKETLNKENIDKPIENKEIKVKQVSEGKVTIRQTNDTGTFSPFYNPAQELNRDISVVTIATYMQRILEQKEKKLKEKEEKNKETTITETNNTNTNNANLGKDYKFTLVDVMSATGLRAVRYLRELDHTEKILANDLDSKAVDLIKINAELNGDTENKIEIHQNDAAALMYSKPKYFDVVDLDPYGTAIPLIDSAILSCKNNGLVLATFTDMQVLCGNYVETCYYKYGSVPFKTPYCHEMAMRMALYSISSAAAKYKRTIIPLFSFNAEFYIRMLFIVKDSAEACQELISKHGQVLQCKSCQYRKTVSFGQYDKNSKKKLKFRLDNFEGLPGKCPVCDGFLALTGPYWIGDLHDEEFLKSTLDNLHSDEFQYLKYNKRIVAIINGMLEEHQNTKEIFGYSYAQIFSDISASAPKLSKFNGGVTSLGYKLVQSYYDSDLIKVNADSEVLYNLVKKFKFDLMSKEEAFKNIKENSYRYNILKKELPKDFNPIFIDTDFNKDRAPRYLPNPFKNWGPKGRAKEIKYVAKNIISKII